MNNAPKIHASAALVLPMQLKHYFLVHLVARARRAAETALQSAATLRANREHNRLQYYRQTEEQRMLRLQQPSNILEKES